MSSVVEKVLGNAAASLLGERRFLKESELENAIAILMHARRVEFYGVGNSGIVAQDAQHKFSVSVCPPLPMSIRIPS